MLITIDHKKEALNESFNHYTCLKRTGLINNLPGWIEYYDSKRLYNMELNHRCNS